MTKTLLLTLLFGFTASTISAQTFRLKRPVSDTIQTNGSYLFAEPAASISSATAHQGIDMDAVYDSVYAAHSGVIGFVANEGSCGLHIIIDDYWEAEKINTLYCHLDEAYVSEGDSIEAGDVIALSGNTGNSTGPHLHFEVRTGRHSGDSYTVSGGRKNPELWVAMEGMGAIYGKVPNAEEATRVNITPNPKPRPPYDTYGWSLTYTFANGIGSDRKYAENYAIGDVVPGEYTIISGDDYERKVVVEAGQVVDADAFTIPIENEPEIASEISLHQNYPNPFNPSTQISYSIPENSFVKLAVYDVMGKQVAELANRQMPAGTHEVNFNASELSSGLYLYRLTTDGQILTKKLT
ncbi:MAG: peptidoglycan DD-metalloendopeptidase family protein, partial [Balneolaceae bacterium]